ncbi:MAG: nicotinamide-nucleotide amidohydrolase family protein [Phycisphaerales bacterium]|nr:nicotinamide-nucleotide amidohydrolase family protein [Phycisphaerales bacterium]
MHSSGSVAAILSVGDEVVTGAIVDTNAAWLAGELTGLGFRVRMLGAVRDERGEIAAAFREAIFAAQAVIVTGGLGPTADDLTREGLADALGVPLEHSVEAEAQITALYQRLQRSMPRTTMRQAQVPRGCEVVPNPWGTAPGVAWQALESGIRPRSGPPSGPPSEHPSEPPSEPPAQVGGFCPSGNTTCEAPAAPPPDIKAHPVCASGLRIYLLPGVPVEMKNMFAASIRPELERLASQRRTVRRIVRTYGMTEATLGEALEDLMPASRNPHVGVNASEAVISVRINATAESQAEAARLAEEDVAEVRRRLGDAVFGEGDATLAHAVAVLLTAQGRRVATAESCTGGLLAKMLTDVSGSSAYFTRGYVTYADEAKAELLGVPASLLAEHGAVSEEVARSMAAGCLKVSSVDFAVSITGVAGPTGGSAERPVGLVCFGVADTMEVTTKRVLFGEHLSREQIRDRAAKTALNLLRLRLLRGERGSTKHGHG